MAILSIKEPPNFDNNIYYEVHPRLDRKRKFNLIAVYGKISSGKNLFVNGLNNLLSNDSWRPQIFTSEMYFKYSRQERNKMLETAWKKFGSGSDYDAVQREAYSIRSEMFEEDLKSLAEGKSVQRANMYKSLSGELYGVLEIPQPVRSNMIIIMNGMWLSGFRKHFNAMIRVEAPYEVRRRRYEERAAKTSYPALPWTFDNLDRVIEEDIYKNWDVNDVVVRSEEGFRLE
jgi:uridine kinase